MLGRPFVDGMMGDRALDHDDLGPRDGFPVILLHGFPLARGMWRHQAEALARDGFRVVLPDLPGHGRSASVDERSLATFAEAVLALADRLGLRRFALGGFSMGGYVAFEVVRRAPSRVAALMLVDTRAEPDSEEAQAGRHATAAKVRGQGAGVLVDAMLPKLLTERTRQEDPALADEVRRMILATPPEGAARALEAMAKREDQRVLLRELRVPTLVVVGEADALTPPSAAQVIADAVQGARLVVVPGAAHLTPMERPEGVTEPMRALLRGLT